MGTKIAVTENGVHKIGKKLFLTDENRVHRKAKKAFLTKDGVHRLVYSSGAIWEKWDCEEVITYTYEPTTEGVGNVISDSCRYDSHLYTDYFFKSSGFEGYGTSYTFSSIDAVDEDDVVGKYIIYPTGVYEIISLDGKEGDYYYVTCEKIGTCEEIEEITYTQGSGKYATFEVEEGELPEEGTLVDGSPTGEYCVLRSPTGGLYYYVRGD